VHSCLRFFLPLFFVVFFNYIAINGVERIYCTDESRNGSRASLTGKCQKLLKCHFHIVMLDIEIARENSEYLYATRVTFDKTLSARVVTRRPICVYQPCIIGYKKEMNSFHPVFSEIIRTKTIRETYAWQSKAKII